MKFLVCHMRNYHNYCESEDTISEKTVELDQVEAAVLQFYNHDSFLDEYDWIEIHPDLKGREHK